MTLFSCFAVFANSKWPVSVSFNKAGTEGDEVSRRLHVRLLPGWTGWLFLRSLICTRTLVTTNKNCVSVNEL